MGTQGPPHLTHIHVLIRWGKGELEREIKKKGKVREKEEKRRRGREKRELRSRD